MDTLGKGDIEGLAVQGNVVVLAKRKKLLVVDASDPTTVSTTLPQPSSRWVSQLVCLEFNPRQNESDALLASACGPTVVVWDVAKATELRNWAVHSRPVSGLNWSPFDANMLATCSDHKEMLLFDVRAPKPSRAITAPAGASQIKWSRHHSNTIASAHEGNVRIWDLRRMSPTTHITAHMSRISSLDWSYVEPDQLVTCASSTHNQVVRFWDLKAPKHTKTTIRIESVGKALFTPFGRGLVTTVYPRAPATSQNETWLWSTDDIESTPEPNPVATFAGRSYFAWRMFGRKTDAEFQLVTWRKGLQFTTLDVPTYQALGHRPGEQVLKSTLSHPAPVKAKQAMPVLKDLVQEFDRLRKHGIPNIAFKSFSEAKRCCELTATVGQHPARILVQMRITFPALYPRGAPPSFNFVGAATLRPGTQTKLKQEISIVADKLVSRNQVCLAPCLRKLIDALRGMRDDIVQSGQQAVGGAGRSSKSQAEPADAGLETLLPSSNRKLARVCGAHFTPSGLLITFGNQVEQTTFRRPPEGVTPFARIMSSSPNEGSSITSFFRSSRRKVQPRPSSSAAAASPLEGAMLSEGPQCSRPRPVSIKDACPLQLLQPALGLKYAVFGDSASAVCQRNAETARGEGREDLVNMWTTLAAVLDNQALRPSTAEFGTRCPWQGHPLGGGIIASFLQHYVQVGDIQTVAMIACVAQQPLQNLKTTTAEAVSYANTVSQVEAAALQRRLKAATMFTRKQIDETSSYMRAYAGVLRAWGLTTQATEIAKLSAPSSYGQNRDGLDFVVYCSDCDREVKGPCCERCHSFVLRCSVCRMRVQWRCDFCSQCGHGGHEGHLRQWFADNETCPTGCGCRCLEHIEPRTPATLRM
eukprot:m.6776 g.6776  ORF g.6776 m.6776 type:complete len:869 (+) comp2726_c0_seq1:82-2688(+)